MSGGNVADPKVTRVCEICERPFSVWPCLVRRGHGKSCSPRCRVVLVARRNTKSLAVRLFSRVKKTETCWLWTGSTTRGYGKLDGRRYAHRVSYELAHGQIPVGFCVLHRCDTPACVRPDHLFLGTDADNVRDMISKNRHSFGSRNGQAKLTARQVRTIRRLRREGVPAQTLRVTYRVSRELIDAIVRRARWKHVA